MASSPTEEVAFRGDDIIRDYIQKYSNWGRWGEDDQLGAMNHVGPEQIRAAAALVRQGKAISMGLPLDLKGPQSGGFRANPLNMMTATGTDYLAGNQALLPGGFGPSKGFGFADDVLVTPTRPVASGTASRTSSGRGRCTTASTPATSRRAGPRAAASRSCARASSCAGCCSTWPATTASTA
jgi:hypothetical protein